MISQSETIRKTRLFGLNTYEAKIWIALLSRGVSTAGELSDIANVPRSRSYDVLESLEKKGFVVMKLGKPIKYLAVPPKEVLENIKRKVEKNTESYLGMMKGHNFNKLIEGLQQLHEKNVPDQNMFVAVVRGRGNIYKHLSFILNNTKKEVFLSLGGQIPLVASAVNNLKSQGIQTSIQNSGLRLGISDENHILIFPVSEEEIHPDYDLCIWIRNQVLAKFFKSLLSPKMN